MNKYKYGTKGKYSSGILCPHCLGVDGIKVYLVKAPVKTKARYECKECMRKYYDIEVEVRE